MQVSKQVLIGSKVICVFALFKIIVKYDAESDVDM